MFSERPYPIKTIAEYHRFMELPKPEHPLISVVKFEEIKRHADDVPAGIIHEFYTVALKKNFNAKLKYGQQDFDFDEGVMHFMAPKQLLTIQAGPEEEFRHTGWLLLIHPDFLWNTALAKKIRRYEYFTYKVSEALFLSEKEEILVSEIIEMISNEYHTNLDQFSQEVILAQIELLLTYCDRFYQRQFITRKINNHKILHQLEEFLYTYFLHPGNKGLPSVQMIAEHLHVSPNYLSRILQQLTGRSTRHFIQDKLIDLAKEKLSTTELSVNEIAYSLGFEHPQSFNKLFKNKTKFSPLAFRQSFQ